MHTVTKALAFLATVLTLQACVSKPLDAPPAPCASTERDCGPAQRLNGSFAFKPLTPARHVA
jgi:predicted small lipoprotein YifL